MKRVPRNLAGPLAAGSLILLLSPAGAIAQRPAETSSDESPYWWTLSPDLSPAALRKALLDPEDHKRQYLLAVEHKFAEPISDERLAQLAHFVDGKLTPERFRAPEVFEMLVLRFRNQPWWTETVGDTLERYGLDAAAREAILEVTRESLKEHDQLMERLGPMKKEFINVRQDARKHLGEEAFRRAVESRDIRTLALATGRTDDEIRKLADAWEEDPEEVAWASLVLLKRLLSERDWNRFREFLREEVARSMTGISFHEAEADDQ